MKLGKKIVVTILLILLVSSMAMVLVGCDNNKDPNKDLDEDTKPIYEIKLYDDNWVELEKKEGFRSYKDYEVEYDGAKKGVNAKCFIDDEVFFTYDYRLGNDNNLPSPLYIYKEDLSDFPIERGEYKLTYEFDVYLHFGSARTPSGRLVEYRDLPLISFSIYIIIK